MLFCVIFFMVIDLELLNYEILNATGEADKNSIPMFSCDTYPCFLDLAFPKNMSVHDVIAVFPEEAETEYEIFSSLDGVNFYTLGKSPKIARFIRIFIKYYSGSRPTVNNVEILGEDCTFPQKKTVFHEPCVFEESPYCAPVTDEDILEDVKGIISRAIGEKYVEQFELKLDRRLKDDYFTVESLRGKVRLISNSGIGLACAFNCYLKEVCKCHISRFGKQVKLPANLPAVNGKIDRRTDFKYRYVYNPCVHGYSAALWGEEEWQREIDFLAMNGVNLVADLTGMAEVYRRFLSKLGYRLREIKNFLTGPFYLPWLSMGNVYGIGGPVHDDFFFESCELARKNHRRMKILSMDIVLQAYTGTAPCDINKKDRDVPVIPQGKWNSLQRPLIINPDSVSFIKFASLFYEAQKEVFGDITHFYAGDICHEGGSLKDADRKQSYSNIIESLLAFDKSAVWVMQSWGDNPSKQFTKAVKPYRDEHILMLDLYAEKDSKNEGRFAPLAKFNCLFGVLNNFGGRNGLFGDISSIPEKIYSAAQKENLKGIALTAESVSVNPAVTDMFFSCVWEKITDPKKWLYEYAVRRYGKESENIARSMDLLLDTVYSGKNESRGEGAPECGLCCRPQSSYKSASAWGGMKIAYSSEDFDKAAGLFLADYDKFKKNECYIYDAVDILRQALSNRITDTVKNIRAAYKAQDYFTVSENGERLLQLADMLDRTLLNCREFSLSSYLGRVCEYSEKLDDFTREIYIIGAKALITTWYSRPASERGKLHDYANRQWGDLIPQFYKMRWEKFLSRVKTEMDGGKAPEIDWFKTEWDWVLEEPKYTKRVREDSLKALAKQIFEQ